MAEVTPIELRRTKVYQRFVELATLTRDHREELQRKRGFSDTIIDSFRFRSAGPWNRNLLDRLRDEFPAEDLVHAGVFARVNNSLVPSKQLLDDRVIIPYLDENGNVYHLRPHKLGFNDVPIQVFARYLLRERPDTVVLTEGEFKAVACQQWEIPAIAVPGVSSFGGRHFERLVELLQEFGVRQIVVIFDNEVKNDPRYPNFKEKVENRYDTEFWAYVMAYKLDRHGFPARVGILPGSWRVNGKIDLDGALAQGKSRAEIERVIDSARAPRDFLETQEPEALRVLRRKIARYFTHSPVRREFNRYVIERRAGDQQWEETISNFVVNIRSNYFTADGCFRNVQFVNEFGEVSETFTLEPGDMAGPGEFKKFCFSKGNYIFEGKGSDLTAIWKYEFLRDSGEMIYLPDRIGRVSGDLWLFGNLAVKGDKTYFPDEDGIIWVDGQGYKPQGLHIDVRGQSIEDSIPNLYTGWVDVEEIATRLRHSVGGYEAYIGLGWVAATVFSREIFRVYKCMPFIFPHGKRESGKTTFMRWLMACFGIETEGTSIKESTQNYIMRALSYFSSLGVWFDEYRNESSITSKDGYLRSAYNRQLSGKGIKESFGARGYTVNGCLAISGEELPRDNGLFTRCVPLQISENKRDRTYYEWLNKNSEKFSGFVYHLVVNHAALREKVLANIHELKAALVERDITDRAAENWAILAGAFEATVFEDDEFVRWVERACQEVKRASKEEHMLSQFWNDVNYLEAKGEISKDLVRVDNDRFYFWFSALYDEWASHYRKRTGKEPFDRLSILKYMQEEPYYLESNVAYRLNGVLRKCHVIDLKRAPGAVQELADHALTRYPDLEDR